MSRYYTVQQANEKLPELSRLLEEMQAHGRQLSALQAQTDARAEKIKSNGDHNPAEDTMLAQASRGIEESLRAGIEQLVEWDIELKDLGRGLVDFPAMREGRVVFLCWELGEPEVAFWHETTTGFAGRQPLDDQLP